MPIEHSSARVTLLLILASIATGCASSPSYYVAQSGNDAAAGTKAQPFATIQHALGVAKPGETIALRGGIHWSEKPIEVRPDNSGVTIAAYEDERAVISGGRLITNWQPVRLNDHDCYVADLPQVREEKWYFRQLFVNKRRAIRARHPNTGYFRIDDVPDKTASWENGHWRFRFAEGDINDWKMPPDAEGIVMMRWVESRLPIAEIDAKDRIISFHKKSQWELQPKDQYYLEGAPDFFDQPGEWYLDARAGKLYYLPRVDEDMRDAQVIAPAIGQLMTFAGDPTKGQFIDGVTLRGVTFAHTEWSEPRPQLAATRPTTQPTVTGGFPQAAIPVPAAVSARGLRNSMFDRCTFEHMGTYALALETGCQNNKVTRCTIEDMGAGGIKIGEGISPTGDARQESSAEATSSNSIADCRIRDLGRLFHSAVGIWIGQSSNNVIAHNEISDVYYTGLSIGWTWGYGASLAHHNRIEYNHVHHIGIRSDGDGPILSDMGGIYTLGVQPGTVIRNNVFHDIAAAKYGGWGIYFDEGTSNVVAENNIAYNTTHGGFHQHYGRDNVVSNNIFAFAKYHQIQRTKQEDHNSFTFDRNIVYFDKGDFTAFNDLHEKMIIRNNLYWRTDGKPLTIGKLTWEQWRAKGMDEGSIVADPMFKNPAEGDFSFARKSPANSIGFQAFDPGEAGPQK